MLSNPPWVDAIKARVEKATPGPWESVPELRPVNEFAHYSIQRTAKEGGWPSYFVAWMCGGRDVAANIWRDLDSFERDVLIDKGVREDRAAKPDAEFIAHAREDIPRLLRAVEVLGEAVEKSAARVFEPDEFADEDDLWTCEECDGCWVTPVKEVHSEWCTVGIARRALADVQSLPSAPGATEE